MDLATIDQITNLIAQGRLLLDEQNFNKEKLKIWELQTKRILAKAYDDEIAKEFSNIFGGGMVIRQGMNFYTEHYHPRIVRGINFLESLQTTVMPEISQEPTQSAAAPQHFHVSGGNVQVGNGNAINVNNITVGDVITALQKEVEAKASDSEEKKGVLAALKTVTSNETFNTVISQTLGAFLGHVIK